MSDSDQLWLDLQAMRRQEACSHEETNDLAVDGIVQFTVCVACGKKEKPSE